ncbi:MAG: hypothetical protein FJ253_10895, partial [Phycisphaerae bacterium]|nr:hypothetical protein [Phycisphaerae bacterium]
MPPLPARRNWRVGRRVRHFDSRANPVRAAGDGAAARNDQVDSRVVGKKAQGLYEALLTEALALELRELPPELVAELRKLRPDEAADRLALHVARALRRSIDGVSHTARVKTGVALVRALLERIGTELGVEGDDTGDPTDAAIRNSTGEPTADLTADLTLDAQADAEPGAATGAVAEVDYASSIPARRRAEFAGDLAADRPVVEANVLTALLARGPDGRPRELAAPLIPLLDTTLLTNAPDEPRVGQQIAAELDSADRIDVVMAFVRRSGLRPLLPALRRATSSGRRVRVLTTTYTGSTELAALEELVGLGAEVRVSYDTSSTRLHAKSWLFHRESGMSTAYIGSSNLTHSAMVTGLEWNVRVSGARNPDVVEKLAAVFEGYWQGGDFRAFERSEFEACRAAADAAAGNSQGGAHSAHALQLSPIELRLEPFQERLLEEIELERERGHHRNLLVAATGTGKTVMAAVDYARLRAAASRTDASNAHPRADASTAIPRGEADNGLQRPDASHATSRAAPSTALHRARLLFVAHRRELLEQSRATFRHALRDASFGELWVGGEHPTEFEHVFASIQSLNHAQLEHLPPTHFDVVIVDEFHHAAAKSYERLLAHVRPRELLGLTATPERADGLSILEHFD